MKIFEDALKKLRKRKEPITEGEFIEQFIQKCDEKSERVFSNINLDNQLGTENLKKKIRLRETPSRVARSEK